MTPELQNRIVGTIRRVCARTFRVAEDVTQAGGILVAGASWDRDGEVRRMLESTAKELRDLGALVQGAAEMIDEPSTERGAA